MDMEKKPLQSTRKSKPKSIMRSTKKNSRQQNPHTSKKQSRRQQQQHQKFGQKIKFTEDNLIINPATYPALTQAEALTVYTDIKNQFNIANIHWGQLKLFYSEVIFLNMCMAKYKLSECVCVYAGAAPGHHNFILRTMYPDLRWILVDPAPFVAKEDSHVAIFNEFFNDEFIEKRVRNHPFAKDRNILFISDIRLSLDVDEKTMSPERVYKLWERAILRDNAMQQEWAIHLGAKFIMLKMHIPMYEPLEAESSIHADANIENDILKPKPISFKKVSVKKGQAKKGQAKVVATSKTEIKKSVERAVGSIIRDEVKEFDEPVVTPAQAQTGGAPKGDHYKYNLSSVMKSIANPEIFDNINYNTNYPYLDGIICKQLYSPRNSTETRLICECESDGKYKFKVYNAELYTRQLYHFNMNERKKEFAYKRSNIMKYHLIGMNDSYSSVAEYFVIDQYLSMLNKNIKTTPFLQSLEVIKMLYMIHKNMYKITNKTVLMCAVIDILKQVREHDFRKKFSVEDRRNILKYVKGQLNQLWHNINTQIRHFTVPQELILEQENYSEQNERLAKTNSEISRMRTNILKFLT